MLWVKYMLYGFLFQKSNYDGILKLCYKFDLNNLVNI